MPEQKKEKRPFEVVGAAVPNVDAVDKVTGRAKYGADYNRKGQLFGRVKYSEHPHAKILGIDTARAVALSGVRAVLTHRDIPGEESFGTVIPHQMVLCSDRVRFLGDVVAVVAADTEEIACRAAELITVEYEPLPVVTDMVEALREDSPSIHPGGNLCIHHRVRKGDAQSILSKSPIILEREYFTQKVEHAYLEPEAVLAEPGEGGGVTVTGSVQNLYSIRRALARVLDLPLSRVRIRQATLGGSFGGKDETMSALCCRAALLSMATGRPVKMVNTREDSMRESYKRHPYRMRYRVGASSDGVLQAIEITVHADAGAYAAMSPFVTWRSAVQATGPYVIPNVRTDVFAVYTNNCYTGAMRGFGSPQVCFASESLMDELAEKVGVDPLEIRLRNVLRDGSETATGQKLDHKVSVERALLSVTEEADFKRKLVGNRTFNRRSSVRRGIGISCSYRGISLGAEGVDAAGVVVSLQTDGSVIVSSGLVDMGQGAATTISMIVAEELGVTLDRIRFLNADTSRLPDSGPTVASRTSFMAGNAARRGCQEILERVRPVAAEILGCADGVVAFENNFALDSLREEEPVRKGEGRRGSGRRAKGKQSEAEGPGGGIGSVRPYARGRIEIGELASLCFQRGISLYAHGWYKGPPTTWDEATGQGDAYFTFVYGANLAEVEVDTLTGKVRVVRFLSCHDVGRVLNLNGARGQVFGGVAMGLGYALFEEYGEQNGRSSLENFDEYLLPTVSDIPEIDIVFLENPDRLGPYGAKSLGEPACEIAAPAIVNATCAALGTRLRSLPLTLEKVRLGKGLSRRQERGSHRVSPEEW